MRTRDLTLVAMLSASLTAGKMALSAIPNVEVVTFLLVVFTLQFGFRRTLATSMVFVTTEILLYGFGTWLLGYYIMWPSLVGITALISSRNTLGETRWAVVSGMYGFLFGLFFAVTESLFYGPAYGLAYWLHGIPFDLVHGTSNFILMLVLFNPIHSRLAVIRQRFEM